MSSSLCFCSSPAAVQVTAVSLLPGLLPGPPIALPGSHYITLFSASSGSPAPGSLPSHTCLAAGTELAFCCFPGVCCLQDVGSGPPPLSCRVGAEPLQGVPEFISANLPCRTMSQGSSLITPKPPIQAGVMPLWPQEWHMACRMDSPPLRLEVCEVLSHPR